jgi:FAD/FMN-containing dehydrogenase
MVAQEIPIAIVVATVLVLAQIEIDPIVQIDPVDQRVTVQAMVAQEIPNRASIV